MKLPRRLTPLVVATSALALVACGATDTTDPARPAADAESAPALSHAEPHADASTDVSYDEGTAITVELADGATTTTDDDAVRVDGDVVTLTTPGTYLLSGELTNGRVLVDSEADGEVRVVLDDASVTSSAGSPLEVARAGETTVVLADGSRNTLGLEGTDGDEDAAALHSSDDLTVAGDGSLSVSGASAGGIVSEQGLVILSGDVTVDAAGDGIHGADYLVVEDGTLDVAAGGNGLTAEKDADESLGYVEVVGGEVTVADAEEGIEARSILVSGGTVDVTAREDGLNASSDTATPALTITGGTVEVDAEGDGIDSNGTLEITGGEVTVAGPTGQGDGALDVDSDFVVSGGTLLAAGSAGMAVAPSPESGQGWVQVTFPSTVAAGSDVAVLDADGEEVVAATLTKDAGNLVVSAAGLDAGEDYTVTVDRSEVATVTAGESTGGGPGGPPPGMQPPSDQ